MEKNKNSKKISMINCNIHQKKAEEFIGWNIRLKTTKCRLINHYCYPVTFGMSLYTEHAEKFSAWQIY